MEENSPVLKGIAPWGIHPLPQFVKRELERRPTKYAGNSKTAVRSAWLRVCSNGRPRDKKHPGRDKDGFVFFGPNKNVNFEQQFGFGSPGGIRPDGQVIGYDVTGNKLHTLSVRTFPNRPPPGVESVETEFYGAGSSFPGLCKKATIKWKCFSVEQLEYLTPYLMSLSVTMVIEWGWNDYRPVSLIDLTNKTDIINIFKFPDINSTNSSTLTAVERMELSDGNYDCHVGRIIDYGYTMNAQGIYEGYTVVVNPTAMFEGNSITNQSISAKTSTGATSFKDFMRNHFDNIPSYFKDTKNDSKIPTEVRGYLTKIRADKGRGMYFKFDEDLDKLNKSPRAKFWISMRMVEQLLNLYGTIRDTENSPALFNFSISDVVIGARPFLKAVPIGQDERALEVIFPSSFAPRLMRIYDSENGGRQVGQSRLKSIPTTTENADYGATAKELAATLNKAGFADDYDDLRSLMLSKHSFPMFSKSTADMDVGRTASPGFWGYLGDIYISNELFKKSVESTDTFQKMLEYILGVVSTAGSNIWEFKVIPNGTNGITVIDNIYCPSNTPKETDKLVRFVIGQTESSAFTSYGMQVQMKQEMATQTLLSGQSSVDVKDSYFVDGDRLFEQPGSFVVHPPKSPAEVKKDIEEANEASKKKRDTQNLRARDEGFIVNTRGSRKYYMDEKDAEFMKQQLQLAPASVTAPASPIMPGTEFTFEMPGISGFHMLGLFTLDAVPEPYRYDRALFQIRDVKNTIKGNFWTTNVVAQVRPLSVT